MKTLAFSNGDRMPILGLGTWQSEPGVVQEAVREAIRLGYRHIDCAMAYGNEAEIGQAIRAAIAAGDVRREELWITSKLWCNAHGRDNVEGALRQSLRNFGLDYLDLYLMHWPIPLKPNAGFPLTAADFEPPARVPVQSTWEGMEAAVAAGLTRHIGVSNFSIRKLRDLLPRCRIRVELNQIELHPLLQQPELVKYCASEGIHVMAWSPLGSSGRPAMVKAPDAPVVLENPVIKSIAQGRGCTPAQVLLAWHVQRGIAAIPKSVSPARLRENLAAADIELSQADLERIAGLDQNYRMIDGSFFVVEGGPWTLQTIWDTR
ncbi:MAG: aldo/keto reductase [Steroidobacteraceae bacterium]